MQAVGADRLLLVDFDSGMLSGATVSFTGRPDGTAEALSADTSGTHITSSFNGANGVLTLSGSDTLLNYQRVLRSLLFNDTAGSPTPGSGHALTVAVADCLLHRRDYVDALHDYVHAYPAAGYARTFFHWANSRRREPYNSWGNGSAMRDSPDPWESVNAPASISSRYHSIVARRVSARGRGW